ncbi:hypothetical protein PYCC9005_004671 [Savitreella phatthalungensis]
MLKFHHAYLSDDLARFTDLVARSKAESDHRPAQGSYKAPVSSKLKGKRDINLQDSLGRTVLHHIASDGRIDFLEAILDHPALDVAQPDRESGWSAVHRALYNGRVEVVRILLTRLPSPLARELLEQKDAEGNTPFDVYNATVSGVNPPRHDVTVGGTDFFSFGSNANHTLGFSDADDRAFPERVMLRRPVLQHEKISKFRPQRILDVVMAKYHTLVLTDDSSDNLYACGFANAGRLGFEGSTQFTLRPIKGVSGRAVAMAAAQDHSLAVTESGELYAWGANKHGQLGYEIDTAAGYSATPRKVVKLAKEPVIGVAVSPIHSVAFTDTSLWTWGLNEGQLGYEIAQSVGAVTSIPRKVTSLSSPVKQATATRHATICLLEGAEVLVFTSYGYFRLALQFDRFSSQYSVFRPRKAYEPARVVKVVSGGGATRSTIAVLTNHGDVFSFVLDDSTRDTKPSLVAKQVKLGRVWSLRKKHLAVRDLDVGQEGDIAMCTESGSVFLRQKRTSKQPGGGISGGAGGSGNNRIDGLGPAKDYRITQISRITRITAVRASETGAFGLIRDDVDPLQIKLTATTLAEDLLCVLPYAGIIIDEDDQDEAVTVHSDDSETEEAADDRSTVKTPAHFTRALDMLKSPTFEDDWEVDQEGHDLVFSVAGKLVPAHQAICCARSSVLRALLLDGQEVAGLKLEVISDPPSIAVEDMDLRSFIVVLHWIYTDLVLQTWSASTHRQPQALQIVQANVKRLSLLLGLKPLSKAMSAAYLVRPRPSLPQDIAALLRDTRLLELADMQLALADGETRHCHSAIVASRSEFFSAMFEGAWVEARRSDDAIGQVTINVRHIDAATMDLVLDHIYGDADISVFDELDVPEVEDLLEIVLKVLAVATELMLPRLREACQAMLRDKMHRKNLAVMLHEADVYSCEQLKEACLDYAARNLDLLIQNNLLTNQQISSQLMHDLELDIIRKQIKRLPLTKSGRLLGELIQRHPSILEETETQRKQYLASLLAPPAPAGPGRTDTPANDELQSFRRRQSRTTPSASPALVAARISGSAVATDDSAAIFSMDDYDLRQDEPFTLVQGSRRGSNRPSPVVRAVRSPDPQVSFSPLPATRSSPAQHQQTPGSASASRYGSQGNSHHRGSFSGNMHNETPAAKQTTRGWSTPAQTPQVVDLRAFMTQHQQQQQHAIPRAGTTPSASASASQASGLTKSIHNARPSQKERKASAAHDFLFSEHQQVDNASPASRPSTSAGGGSPWTAVSASPAASLQSIIAAQTTPSAAAKPAVSRPIVTPTRSTAHSNGRPGPSSMPRQPPASMSLGGGSAHVSASPIASLGKQSLADIIAQETTAKSQLQAYTAKRSMLEIQQEEEFERWFAAESARIKKDEAMAKSLQQQQQQQQQQQSAKQQQAGKGKGKAARSKSKTTPEKKPPQAHGKAGGKQPQAPKRASSQGQIQSQNQTQPTQSTPETATRATATATAVQPLMVPRTLRPEAPGFTPK